MQVNPMCESNSDGIKVFQKGSKTFNAGINQFEVSTSDIAVDDIILNAYTDYPTSGVRYLHFTFQRTNAQWVVCVNNLSGGSQTANVFIVYKKMV